MFSPEDVKAIRSQFPALERQLDGQPLVYFDGPAGSQVPTRVAAAVSDYLLARNANSGGPFVTSLENDAAFEEALGVLAAFVGAADPSAIVFGASMTALTFRLSRALASTWSPGDEILLSRLDHDGNVTPWALAARERGVTVKHIDLDPEDATLDLADFRAKLSPRTRLVALGVASNATGTINPVREISDAAHEVGALVYADAVHYAPHGLIDVAALGCDFLVASVYKFFGPHISVLWGARERLDTLPAAKVRPAYDVSPDRWMQGTPNYEGIAGAVEAVRYIADLALDPGETPLRTRLEAAFGRIVAYERALCRQLIEGIERVGGFTIHGITAHDRLHMRVPTLSVTHDRLTPKEMATRLASCGFCTWPGNHYALPFTEAMGLEPHGTLRIGLLHYNTADEIDRMLRVLAEF